MPEIPEMERYRTVLSNQIIGTPVTDLQITREKSINLPVSEFSSQLLGKSITRIRRRAKYLIFTLSSGKHMLLHLMIGGWLFLGEDGTSPERTKQVTLSFGNKKLYFIGLRLGFLHLLSTAKLEDRLASLGPEPLNPAFTSEVFQQLIRRKRGTLKSILVDQKFIAGVGNCYSDEICFEAGLKPSKKADQLTEEQILSLYLAIRPVLVRAIEIGGYVDYPLYAGDQKTGTYNHHFLVYECAGLPCKRCGTKIVKKEVSSRKSFYCPSCQAE